VECRNGIWSWTVWMSAGAVVGQGEEETYEDARRGALKVVADGEQLS
jgi:hypothetical protein